VQLAFLGAGQPDLTAAARRAVETVGGTWPQLQTWTVPEAPAGGGGSLRGLFAGGTLCDEAMVIAAQELGPIRSNIPLQPDWALADDLRADGHIMIDFGDDRLTQGRAHPMIDQRSRLERIAAEAADPSTAVLLLDVVLGHGAHPDPATELAPALADAVERAADDGRPLAVVISLCGTEGDPQGLVRQGDALAAAGAVVHRSNADAARAAAALAQETG
jgi:FdrA protein